MSTQPKRRARTARYGMFKLLDVRKFEYATRTISKDKRAKYKRTRAQRITSRRCRATRLLYRDIARPYNCGWYC